MQLLRYALKNIFRNIFLSASSILIIGLLVFFVNILIFVIFSTDRFIQSINNRISININFQDGYDNTQLLIESDSNPLPNSVRLSNIEIDEYKWLNTFIGRFRDILQYDEGSLDKKLLDYRSQYERIAAIVKMLNILQATVYIFLGLFVFTVAIVIYMVIHNFIFFLLFK